mmetsp:Transcript_102405/g.316005  ORF Transcript_102405/g.316005 Transcript_102405/m.316005 type:complete len:209 (-) Transcript_102405:38-664(-)
MPVLGRLHRRHRVFHRSNGASGELYADPGDVHLAKHEHRLALFPQAAQLLADLHALSGSGDGPVLGVRKLCADDHGQRINSTLLVPGLLVEGHCLRRCSEGVRGLQRGNASLCEQHLRGCRALGTIGRREGLRRVFGHLPGLFILLVRDLCLDHGTVSVQHATGVTEAFIGGQSLRCLLHGLARVRRQQLERLRVQLRRLVRHGGYLQ